MRSSIEQLAASIASIAGLGLTAAALIVGWWLIAKWLGRVGRPDLDAYGDWPAIPQEMKATGNRSQEGDEPRAEVAVAFGTQKEPRSKPLGTAL